MNPTFYNQIKKDLATAQKLCLQAVDTAFYVSEMVCDDILEVGNFFGRQVKNITEHLLPSKVAAVAQKVFNSTLFIACWHILPHHYCTFMLCAVSITSAIKLKPFSQTTYVNFYNAQAFHFLTNAAKDLVSYTLRGHFSLFIAMCLDLAVSAVYAVRAQHIEHANS